MLLNKNTFILSLLVVVPVSLSFLSKFEFSNSIPFFKNLDELALLFLIKYSVKGFLVVLRNKRWVWLIFFFLGYILIGVISSYANNVELAQVTYQLIISFKVIFVLSVIIGADNQQLLFERYIIIAKYILVISLPLIVWQFISFSTYDSIFSNGLHHGSMLYGDGNKVLRGVGVFTHPGQMAIFSSSYIIMLFYLYFHKKIKVLQNIRLWLFVAIFTLLLTFSRLEIAATVSALIGTFFITTKGNRRLVNYLLGVLFLGSLVTVMYPVLLFIYQQSLGDGLSVSSDPRVVFLLKGIEIANDFFPFGSGLGTYGGYVAAISDSSVYMDYGFQGYYWYNQGSFLADTFWPHILGETGYFGFFSYVLFLLVLMYISLKSLRKSPNNTFVGKMMFSLIILITLNSFASPDMVSILSLAHCFIPIGYLYYISTKKSVSNNKLSCIE